MKKGLAIVLIIVALVLGAGGTFIAFFMYNKNIVATYEENVAILNAKIDAIGPGVEVYTYRTDVEKGQVITEDMLEMMTVPSTMTNDSFITDTSAIIGLYSKVDVKAGTPITDSLIMTDDINNESELYNTVREYDVVVNLWPIGLEIGDYVDLRFLMPYGEEYIVLSHMRVEGMSEATVKFKMTEVQINLYQSAMVDYFLNSGEGAILYFTKYIEPGVQEPANITYKVSDEIMEAMKKNSNLYATAWASVYDYKVRAQIESDLVKIPVEEGEEAPSEKDEITADLGGISGGRNSWVGTITGGEEGYTDGAEETEVTEDTSGGALW